MAKPWKRPAQAKLTPEQRDQIRHDARMQYPMLKAVAEHYGIHPTTVAAIRDGLGGYRHY